MKIAIFADIHGNIHAFRELWRQLRGGSYDLYCFLGDICGYYYHQNEIIRTLMGIKNLICVAGNHDTAFLEGLKDEAIADRYRKVYGKSCDILKDDIEPECMEFLERLPERTVLEEEGIAIFHGSPWNNLEGYVYPDADLAPFEDLTYKYVFMGHTHYAMRRRAKEMCMINPGSCGQPRDLNLPSYAVLDSKSKDVKIKRFDYDKKMLIKEIESHSEANEYLADVLKR